MFSVGRLATPTSILPILTGGWRVRIVVSRHPRGLLKKLDNGLDFVFPREPLVFGSIYSLTVYLVDSVAPSSDEERDVAKNLSA